MTRRLPPTAAAFIAAALGLSLALSLAAPIAAADPGAVGLDDRRDDLLGEMQGHLARWKTRPARSPTKSAPPTAGTTQPPPSAGDAIHDDSDVIHNDSDVIHNDSDVIHNDSDVIHNDSNVIHNDSNVIHNDSDIIHSDSDAISAADCAEPAAAPELMPAPALEPAPIAAAPSLPAPTALPEPPTLPTPAAVAAPSIDEPPSSPETAIPLGRHDAEAISAAVLVETNAARARHGLPPMEPHPALDGAAIEYAAHLARTGHFGHIDLTRAGMEEPSDRVRAAGGADVLAAENLITETWLQVDGGEQMFVVDESRHQYSRTPDGPLIPPHSTRSLARSMVQRWLESPGHRRNILDSEGRQMGFGMAWDPRATIPSLVAVQVFQRYHRLGEGPDASR